MPLHARPKRALFASTVPDDALAWELGVYTTTNCSAIGPHGLLFRLCRKMAYRQYRSQAGANMNIRKKGTDTYFLRRHPPSPSWLWGTRPGYVGHGGGENMHLVSNYHLRAVPDLTFVCLM